MRVVEEDLRVLPVRESLEARVIFFPSVAKAADHPVDGGLAHPHAEHFFEELDPLFVVGEDWTSVQALFEQLHCALTKLPFPPRCLAGSQLLPLVGHLRVAVDRRDTNLEGTSRLLLGHPASKNGIDYLLPEVHRVRSHTAMMHHRPNSLDRKSTRLNSSH